MTEEVKQESSLPTRKTRRIFSAVAGIFSLLLIVAIVCIGDPDNSLHQSALSWAFSMSMFVMAAYVFSAGYDKFIEHKWK